MGFDNIIKPRMINNTTLYLIRHAQSHPSSRLHHSEWPLSSKGKKQAETLAGLLKPMGIEKIYSSPFVRCLQTVAPFSKYEGLKINLEADLRERLVVKGIVENFIEIWHKSWEDFNFALPGCESSAKAQERFISVVNRILNRNDSTILALSSHGNVIGLFLNSIDGTFDMKAAEEIRNPDVLKVTIERGTFVWNRDFKLSGIEKISTGHKETPVDW